MRALLVTYHFPPMLGCCALRTAAVARLLADEGWECHILTAAIPADHQVYALGTSAEQSHPLWHLHPISEGHFGRMAQRFARIRSRSKSETVPNLPNDLQPRASRTINFLRAIAFPDSKVSWIPGAYRQVKHLLRHHSFDLIYSFGYPWSTHVVASVAQRRAGIPWVADYADPWSLNPDVHAFPKWRKRLDIWLESRLLRRTASVVVATPEAQAFTGLLFGPAVERRTRVARVAQFSSDEYKSPSGQLPEHFQIAFTGLMDSLRQPYAFLDAARVFAKVQDVRICLAGLIGEDFRSYSRTLGLEPLIHHLGRLQRRETIGLQKTSHVLLSFGWPGGLQVPCKIYEYFAARRPLLHIAGDDRDPAATLVRKYRRGLVVPNDPQAIRDGLQTLYDLWLAGKLEEQFDLSQLDEFCLPRSLDGLKHAFDAVISREGRGGAVSTSHAVARAQSAT